MLQFVSLRINIELPNNGTVYVSEECGSFSSLPFEFVRGEQDDTSSLFQVIFN